MLHVPAVSQHGKGRLSGLDLAQDCVAVEQNQQVKFRSGQVRRVPGQLRFRTVLYTHKKCATGLDLIAPSPRQASGTPLLPVVMFMINNREALSVCVRALALARTLLSGHCLKLKSDKSSSYEERRPSPALKVQT